MGKLVASVLATLLLIAALVQPAMGAAAIDGLQVTRAEPHKLVLNWIPERGAQTYNVIQDDAVVGTSNDTWFVVADLAELTDYTFVIRSDKGTESAPATFTTAPVTPKTNISYWWSGQRELKISLSSWPVPIGFEVRRNGVVVAEQSDSFFHDTALTPDTTYDYEIRAIGPTGNLGTVAGVQITTRPLLPQVQGVQAELLEPGVVSVNWHALDIDNIRYRVFVDGDVMSQKTSRTSARVNVPAGTTSVIHVAGFNGSGGPLSDPVTVTSGQIDPRQIGLEVHRSWPGTLVLKWRNKADSETVLVDGNPVGTGKGGWITLRDLPYNTPMNVSVLTQTDAGEIESITYPIRSASVELYDVTEFRTSQVSADSVKLNWKRRTGWLNFEVLRDGVVISSNATPPFVDTGLSQGTTYVYSIRVVAPGATGVSNPVLATVTTLGVPQGTTPDAPYAEASFADNSRVVIKVALTNGDQQSYHRQLEILRNGVSLGTIPLPPTPQQFAYFVDGEVDRNESAEYTIISVSPDGLRSNGTSVQVAPRQSAQMVPTGY